MKKFNKLNLLPLGAIKAEGFLKDQLLIGKDGMSGHLHEIEPEMIADPYVKDTHVPFWSPEFEVGWQAEISGNYWTGYIMNAFVLNDKEMIERATKWVDDTLKTQLDDGYLGTYRKPDADKFADYCAGAGKFGYRALIAFYEATGRKDVLEAIHRAMIWFCNNWTGDKKTCYAGQGIIEPMIHTYFHTGDERLVEFAEEYLQYMVDHDIFKKSYKSMLNEDLRYFADHAAGLSSAIRYPALVYAATGNKEYLAASERRIQQALDKCIHPTGGASCAAEYVAPVASTTEYEYCSFTYFNQSWAWMSAITGNSKYGDLMEQVVYNAAQGARKKDEKAIAYLTAPNQIYATMTSSSSGDDVQVYSPCYRVACCPVNAVLIIPEFIKSMMVTDNNDNIYVMAYGPCTLNYKDISISEKTLYPFRDNVVFEVNSDKAFTLNLKVPEWAKGYKLTINGKEENKLANDGFVAIEREWKKGDTVEITFKTEIEILRIDDTDYAKKYPLAFKRGALMYSFHIPENWVEIEGRPSTPLPEDWHWYDVRPSYEEAPVPDVQEQIGLRRFQYSWNIVVDENLTPDDFEVEEVPENGYVWANPVIKLHSHCYKAPYMTAVYQCCTHEPFGDYQEVTEKLPLTLVPYGCTNLRLTYFHKADLKNFKG